MTAETKTPDAITGLELRVLPGFDNVPDLAKCFKDIYLWVVSSRPSQSEHLRSIYGNLLCKDPDFGTTPMLSARESLINGLPGSTIDRAEAATALSTKELSDLILIKPRTLTRRRTENLQADESDRLWRLMSAFQTGIEVFEDLEATRNWFRKPKSALGGLTPFQCCNTTLGAKEVEALLHRLEHSVYS